jgi:hypothetical protein
MHSDVIHVIGLHSISTKLHTTDCHECASIQSLHTVVIRHPIDRVVYFLHAHTALGTVVDGHAQCTIATYHVMPLLGRCVGGSFICVGSRFALFHRHSLPYIQC